MLQPLFGIEPPDWTEKPPDQGMLQLLALTGDGVDEEPETEFEETEGEDDDTEPEE